MEGEGMVAVVHGLRDTGLAVTLMDGNRQYTLRPTSTGVGTHSTTNKWSNNASTQQNSPRNTADSATEPGPLQCDRDAQAVDGRYTSMYKTMHCNVCPTSPPIQLTEFPPQRPDLCPGQGNFQVGGCGSGVTNGQVRSISPVTSYKGGMSWPDRGSVCSPRPSHVVDEFANSLRKYPNLSPDRSSEVFERLISYTQGKGLSKNSRNQSPSRIPEPPSHHTLEAKSTYTKASRGYEPEITVRTKKVEEPPTREKKNDNHDNMRNMRNYDVRCIRDITRRARDTIRSASIYPYSNLFCPTIKDNQELTATATDSPINSSNSVNMEIQAAVKMISKEVATTPREQCPKRNVAVPDSPVLSAGEDNEEGDCDVVPVPNLDVTISYKSIQTTLFPSDTTLKPKKSAQTVFSSIDIHPRRKKTLVSRKIKSQEEIKISKDELKRSLFKLIEEVSTSSQSKATVRDELTKKLFDSDRSESYENKVNKSNNKRDVCHKCISTFCPSTCDYVGDFQEHVCKLKHYYREAKPILRTEIKPFRVSEYRQLDFVLKEWVNDLNLKPMGYIERGEILCLVEDKIKEIFKSRVRQNFDLKNAIVSVLEGIPIEVTKTYNRKSYLHKLVDVLLKRMRNVVVTQQIERIKRRPNPNRSRRVLTEVEIRDLVRAHLINFFNECHVGICDETVDVIENKIIDIMIDSIDCIRCGHVDEAMDDMEAILQDLSQVNVKQANYITSIILQDYQEMLNNCNFHQTYMILSVNNNYSDRNKNSNDTTDLSIGAITDEDLKNNLDNYTNQLCQQIDEWLNGLNLPQIADKGFREVVVNDLAGDIVDRHKYIELNHIQRGTEEEELEALKYQIFKWINKLVGDKNRETLSHAHDLMRKINDVPVPMLTHPQKNRKMYSTGVNESVFPTMRDFGEMGPNADSGNSYANSENINANSRNINANSGNNNYTKSDKEIQFPIHDPCCDSELCAKFNNPQNQAQSTQISSVPQTISDSLGTFLNKSQNTIDYIGTYIKAALKDQGTNADGMQLNQGYQNSSGWFSGGPLGYFQGLLGYTQGSQESSCVERQGPQQQSCGYVQRPQESFSEGSRPPYYEGPQGLQQQSYVEPRGYFQRPQEPFGQGGQPPYSILPQGFQQPSYAGPQESQQQSYVRPQESQQQSCVVPQGYTQKSNGWFGQELQQPLSVVPQSPHTQSGGGRTQGPQLQSRVGPQGYVQIPQELFGQGPQESIDQRAREPFCVGPCGYVQGPQDSFGQLLQQPPSYRPQGLQRQLYVGPQDYVQRPQESFGRGIQQPSYVGPQGLQQHSGVGPQGYVQNPQEWFGQGYQQPSYAGPQGLQQQSGVGPQGYAQRGQESFGHGLQQSSYAGPQRLQQQLGVGPQGYVQIPQESLEQSLPQQSYVSPQGPQHSYAESQGYVQGHQETPAQEFKVSLGQGLQETYDQVPKVSFGPKTLNKTIGEGPCANELNPKCLEEYCDKNSQTPESRNENRSGTIPYTQESQYGKNPPPFNKVQAYGLAPGPCRKTAPSITADQGATSFTPTLPIQSSTYNRNQLSMYNDGRVNTMEAPQSASYAGQMSEGSNPGGSKPPNFNTGVVVDPSNLSKQMTSLGTSELQDSSSSSTSQRKINEDYDNYVKQWVQRIPLACKTPAEAEKTRLAIYNEIWKSVTKNKLNPDVFSNPYYFKDSFADDTDELLKRLPNSPELETARLRLKNELIQKTSAMYDQIKTSTEPASFKQQLTANIENNLPKVQNVNKNDSMQQSEELDKQDLADYYVLYSRYKDEDVNKANFYKNNVLKKLDEFLNKIKARYNIKDMDTTMQANEIINSLDKVPKPNPRAMQKEADDILFAMEVDRWISDLPLKTQEKPGPLERRRTRDTIAKKIDEVATKHAHSDSSLTTPLKAEIPKYIEKLPLKEGTNVEYMVEELANRIKNTPTYRSKFILFHDPGYDEFSKKIPASSSFVQQGGPHNTGPLSTSEQGSGPQEEQWQSMQTTLAPPDLRNWSQRQHSPQFYVQNNSGQSGSGGYPGVMSHTDQLQGFSDLQGQVYPNTQRSAATGNQVVTGEPCCPNAKCKTKDRTLPPGSAGPFSPTIAHDQVPESLVPGSNIPSSRAPYNQDQSYRGLSHGSYLPGTQGPFGQGIPTSYRNPIPCGQVPQSYYGQGFSNVQSRPQPYNQSQYLASGSYAQPFLNVSGQAQCPIPCNNQSFPPQAPRYSSTLNQTAQSSGPVSSAGQAADHNLQKMAGGGMGILGVSQEPGPSTRSMTPHTDQRVQWKSFPPPGSSDPSTSTPERFRKPMQPDKPDEYQKQLLECVPRHSMGQPVSGNAQQVICRDYNRRKKVPDTLRQCSADCGTHKCDIDDSDSSTDNDDCPCTRRPMICRPRKLDDEEGPNFPCFPAFRYPGYF